MIPGCKHVEPWGTARVVATCFLVPVCKVKPCCTDRVVATCSMVPVCKHILAKYLSLDHMFASAEFNSLQTVAGIFMKCLELE